MRSIAVRRALAVLIGASIVSCNDTPVAPTRSALSPRGPALNVVPLTGSHVVISQIYGAGGNSGALVANDYVELYNGGFDDVDLTGTSIQYASATGTGNFGGTATQLATLSGRIASGHYYLVALAGGSVGAALPAADATGGINMSGSAGKVALVDMATSVGCNGSSTPCTADQRSHIIDVVGFGTGTSGANFFEGSGPAPTVSTTKADFRKDGGRQDTNDNAADFVGGTPAPRNSQSPPLTPIPTVSVAITPSSTSIQVGQTTTFTASASFGGTPVAITSTTWSSANLAVATIDASTGVATGVTRGGSTITVNVTTASGNATATAALSVSGLPATVTVSPAAPSVQMGKTVTLTAAAVDADNFPTTTTFTWSTGDATIATVSATGVVTGVAIGSTTISATSANGKVGSATVSVTPPPAGVSLSIGTTPLVIGYQTQLFVNNTSFDQSGHPLHASDLTWASSDASIVSVDSRGLITAAGSPSAVITATAADGTSGSFTVTTEVPVYSSTARTGHNTEFGLPFDADPTNDVIIARKQYTISYNPQRGGPNWVSWDLSSTHLGTRNRCNCYSADTALARLGYAQYMYTTLDYTNGGYDRGHLEPSADQTTTDGENATTFFLTNFLPQTHGLNAGPWENLENALRDSVNAGREAYVIAGGIFTNGVGLGTIKNEGKIAIPDSTWKIVVLMPANTGIANVASASDVNVIAVNMPNVAAPPTDWTQYKTTVSKIEHSTGYLFLPSLSKSLHCQVGGDCAPAAAIGGSGVAGGNEGQTLSFNASGSTDVEHDALTYSWSIDGVAAGTGTTLSHTFTDNGTYNVRLVAYDGFLADTTTTAVTVLNVAPSVNPFSGATTNKGVAYTASGSFADPGDDSFTATVDYGDGSGAQPLALTGKSFALDHTYMHSGSYTVTVRVTETDPEAATGSSSATVTVVNVAPVVNTFDGATILRGESYAASGSFTDPDPDSWAATVTYGDGSPSTSLALSGKSFSLAHTYATAGTFTVTVTVVDGEATATRTATVIVKSGAAGLTDLGAMVATLPLNNGQLNSLQSKLDAASAQLDKGHSTPAANQLQAFINELNADVSSGKLTAAQAAPVLAYAQRVLATINLP